MAKVEWSWIVVAKDRSVFRSDSLAAIVWTPLQLHSFCCADGAMRTCINQELTRDAVQCWKMKWRTELNLAQKDIHLMSKENIEQNNWRISVWCLIIKEILWVPLTTQARIVQYTVWGCQAVSVSFGRLLKHLAVFPISSLVEYFVGVLLAV